MSTLTVALADEMVERIRLIARTRGVSIDSLVTDALAGAYGTGHDENLPIGETESAAEPRPVPLASIFGTFTSNGEITGANHEDFMAEIVASADRRSR